MSAFHPDCGSLGNFMMSKSVLDFLPKYLDEIINGIMAIDADDVERIADLAIEAVIKRAGKIIVVGNGGSAAIAGHVAVDLTKAAGMRAINFNDAALLTCFGNDYGYEYWVEEAINAYADPEDLIILISSSGRSENMINAAQRADELGINVVTLTGFDEANPLRAFGKVGLWCDSSHYNVVENAHQIWLLAVVDYLIHLKAQ